MAGRAQVAVRDPFDGRQRLDGDVLVAAGPEPDDDHRSAGSDDVTGRRSARCASAIPAAVAAGPPSMSAVDR